MLDAESTQYLAFTDEQKTKNGAEALFHTVLDSYQTEDPIESFALISKESGYYIGSVGFSPCGKDLYECYYAINKEGRRKGFACEAMQHLLALIDKRTVIKAYCSEKNVASIEVAKKIGDDSPWNRDTSLFRPTRPRLRKKGERSSILPW